MNAAAPVQVHSPHPPMRPVSFCIRICGFLGVGCIDQYCPQWLSSFRHFRILNNGHQFTTAVGGNSTFYSWVYKKVRYFPHETRPAAGVPPMRTTSHFSSTLERLAHIQFQPLPSSVTLRQTLMLLFLEAARYFTTSFLSQFLPLPAVPLSLGAFNRGVCEWGVYHSVTRGDPDPLAYLQ